MFTAVTSFDHDGKEEGDTLISPTSWEDEVKEEERLDPDDTHSLISFSDYEGLLTTDSDRAAGGKSTTTRSPGAPSDDSAAPLLPMDGEGSPPPPYILESLYESARPPDGRYDDVELGCTRAPSNGEATTRRTSFCAEVDIIPPSRSHNGDSAGKRVKHKGFYNEKDVI